MNDSSWTRTMRMVVATNGQHGSLGDPAAPNRRLGYGISGISADLKRLGTLICSTICAALDTIYRSTDEGLTWTPVLSGLEIGKIDVSAIDIIGDYGGFVFTELDQPAENTFANPNRDRWITAMRYRQHDMM